MDMDTKRYCCNGNIESFQFGNDACWLSSLEMVGHLANSCSFTDINVLDVLKISTQKVTMHFNQKTSQKMHFRKLWLSEESEKVLCKISFYFAEKCM